MFWFLRHLKISLWELFTSSLLTVNRLVSWENNEGTIVLWLPISQVTDDWWHLPSACIFNRLLFGTQSSKKLIYCPLEQMERAVWSCREWFHHSSSSVFSSNCGSWLLWSVTKPAKNKAVLDKLFHCSHCLMGIIQTASNYLICRSLGFTMSWRMWFYFCNPA